MRASSASAVTFARERRGGNSPERFPRAAEEIRRLLVNNIPHGLKSVVAGRSWDFVADRKIEFQAVPCGRVYGIPPSAVTGWVEQKQAELRRREGRQSHDNLSRMWDRIKRRTA